MATIQSKTVLFITGGFVSHACWNDWRRYFEANGYRTTAPPWPAKNANADTLRCRHPDAALAAVTLPDLIAHYTAVIHQLPEPPILIGHSLGGLLVQILLNQGLAAAGVAVHAVPPQGVIPYEWRFLKSNIQALGFFTSLQETYLMPFRKWQDVFTNGLSLEAQKNAYYELAIPESKRVLRGALTRAAQVDFKKAHNPLLILAGSKDHCIPASIGRRNYNRYKGTRSVTDFVVKDRNHFVLGLPTWQEDAAYIINWLRRR
jgi:pimeloyl-ACP methyl ester carboxylesterase